MADALTLTITATMDWLFNDALDLSTISDSTKITYDKSLTDGTGNSLVDGIWHDTRTISGAAGTADSLDVGALAQTLFGQADTMDFVVGKIKMIYIVNTNTTSGDDLYIDSSVANSLILPFVSIATAKIEIPADSCLLWVNKVPGWTTSATTGIVSIKKDVAADVIYKIVIAGVKA